MTSHNMLSRHQIQLCCLSPAERFVMVPVVNPEESQEVGEIAFNELLLIHQHNDDRCAKENAEKKIICQERKFFGCTFNSYIHEEFLCQTSGSGRIEPKTRHPGITGLSRRLRLTRKSRVQVQVVAILTATLNKGEVAPRRASPYKGEVAPNELYFIACAKKDFLKDPSCLPNSVLGFEQLVNFHYISEFFSNGIFAKMGLRCTLSVPPQLNIDVPLHGNINIQATSSECKQE